MKRSDSWPATGHNTHGLWTDVSTGRGWNRPGERSAKAAPAAIAAGDPDALTASPEASGTVCHRASAALDGSWWGWPADWGTRGELAARLSATDAASAAHDGGGTVASRPNWTAHGTVCLARDHDDHAISASRDAFAHAESAGLTGGAGIRECAGGRSDAQSCAGYYRCAESYFAASRDVGVSAAACSSGADTVTSTPLCVCRFAGRVAAQAIGWHHAPDQYAIRATGIVIAASTGRRANRSTAPDDPGRDRHGAGWSEWLPACA